MNSHTGTFVALLLALSCGLVHAGSEYADSQAMQAAREALYESHGGNIYWMTMAERLEWHSAEGHDEILWDVNAWVGGDMRKLYIKSEGEYASEEGSLDEFELQALYSRAIHPFWDLQVGVRHDFDPAPTRTYGVLGLQGLAPYWFEVDSALYVSERGDVSLRVELEYELRLTQKMLLQPRLEVSGAFSDDADTGQGSGLSGVTSGLRLRYEFTPQIAPYVGLEWSTRHGRSRRYAEEGEQRSVVAGIRFWF